MSETARENQSYVGMVSHADWGSIWVGVFSFLAIWAVFGSLGTAIFAGRANVTAELPPSSGMTVVMAIWGIVLTAAAMYIAGRATSFLARISTFRDGVFHGMAMFGLAVTAVFVLTAFAGGADGITNISGATHSYVGVFAYLGWPGFVALILGWLAAMGGAVSTQYRTESELIKGVRRVA